MSTYAVIAGVLFAWIVMLLWAADEVRRHRNAQKMAERSYPAPTNVTIEENPDWDKNAMIASINRSFPDRLPIVHPNGDIEMVPFNHGGR